MKNPNYKLNRILDSYKEDSILNIFKNSKKVKTWIKTKYNF